MNAEALAHAAKACRDAADDQMKAADATDVFLRRCPDAGSGMNRDADMMRDRAIGLKVASAFLARCVHDPRYVEALVAIEAGEDFYWDPNSAPVVVRDDENPAAPPTLRERINALLPWRVPAKAA